MNDELLRQADLAARDLGVSRGCLISFAVESWLRERNRAATKTLNEVYIREPDSAELRTAKKMKAKFRSIVTERW